MRSTAATRFQWLLSAMGMFRPGPPGGGPVTREAANTLVRWYMHKQGAPDSQGLNEKGFGGALLGEGAIYFEYHEASQALECSALIYRFREPPKPGVIDGFKAEAQEGTDAGGGEVDFEPENGSLFLSRTYTELPSGAQLQKDLSRLLDASEVWGREVLDRVARRVFGT